MILNEGEKNEKAIRVVSKQYTNGLDAIIIEQLHNMYRREISKHSAQRNTDFIFALKIVMQSWGHCFEQLQEIDVLKELCVSQAKEKVTGAEMDEAKLRIESLEKQKAVVAKMLHSHSRLRKAGPAAQQDYLKKVDDHEAEKLHKSLETYSPFLRIRDNSNDTLPDFSHLDSIAWKDLTRPATVPSNPSNVATFAIIPK